MFYRDICLMMSDSTPLESQSHLVAHLLREIESSIREVLQPIKGPKATDPAAAHEKDVRVALAALDIPEQSTEGRFWLAASSRGPESFHGRAHRPDLKVPRRLDPAFHEYVARCEDLFEVVVNRIEAKFGAFVRELDELLGHEVPTNADLDRLESKVPNSRVTLGYFLERLSHPGWLEPLRRRGFFTSPPRPIVDDADGSRRLPSWPASKYLIRMAQLSARGTQDAVVGILLEMELTSNPLVTEDLADVALGLPCDLSARLVPRTSEWLASPWQRNLADKLASLVVRLVQGGEVEAAFLLAAGLIRLEAVEWSDINGPTPSMGDWQYGEVLDAIVPALSAADEPRTLALLAQTLSGTLKAEQRDGAVSDMSEYWRPAIEDHEQNISDGTRGHLVGAVRNVAEGMVRRDAGRIDATLSLLASFGLSVYRRVGLYVAAVVDSIPPPKLEALVLDRSTFDDISVRHEYSMLLRRRFGQLPANAQLQYVNWVAELPLEEHWIERFVETQGRQPTEAEKEERLWSKRLERLVMVADSLQGDWKRDYEHWVARLGEPEHPDFPSGWMSGVESIGIEAPRSSDDLRSMTLPALLDLLRSWKPTPDWLGRGPSREGLGRELADLVKADPSPLSGDAESFVDLHPVYVAHFFRGLTESVQSGQAIEWIPTLALARWALTQRTTTEAEGASSDIPEDADWRWAHRDIARLLSAGLESEQGSPPLALRHTVWPLISTLIADPHPTVEEETRSIGEARHESLLISAINSVRGEGLNAMLRYADWVRRNLPAPLPSTLSDLPEFKAAVEERLRDSVDSTGTTRAVLGRSFAWFVFVDPRWAQELVRALFPASPEQLRLHNAAWNTYLTSQVRQAPFMLLIDEYRRHVAAIGAPPTPLPHMHPALGLTRHLMTAFWHDWISLDSPDGLVREFFSRAPAVLRTEALRFLGRSLTHVDVLDGELSQRLCALWEWRAAQATVDSNVSQDDMAAFGEWFSSGKLDPTWSLEHLESALDISRRTDDERDVIERLVSLVDAHGAIVVRCLGSILVGDPKGWTLMSERDEIRHILGSALNGGDATARREAEELINRLAARGHFAFRDLLDHPN